VLKQFIKQTAENVYKKSMFEKKTWKRKLKTKLLLEKPGHN